MGRERVGILRDGGRKAKEAGGRFHGGLKAVNCHW